MHILVIYADDREGMVDASLLDELIFQKKIKKFLRAEGWCTLGVDPLRRKKKPDYKGPERRENENKNSQSIDVVEHLKEKQLKEDAREKRGCHRYHIPHHNINVELDCTDQIEVLDLSVGGISFKTDLQFHPSQQYELRLKFKDQVIPLRGEVKWSLLSGYKKYSVQDKLFHNSLIPIYSTGMQFINITDSQLTAIMHLIEEYGRKEIDTKDLGQNYDWKDFLKSFESIELFKNVHAQTQDAPRDIRGKSIAEKLKTASFCGKEELSILLKDPKKEIILAAIGNPKITETEIARFAQLPTIPAEAIDKIVSKKEWMKNYSIISALANNPKTPLYISQKLVKRLKPKDLKILMRNRQVSEILRDIARKSLHSQG
jgi:hypothetical protein